MTDLKNGIIEINGFSIGPDTKVEELEKYFDIPARRDDSFSFFDFNKEIIMLNGIDFKLLISFDLEKISSIKLWPQIPEISNKNHMLRMAGERITISLHTLKNGCLILKNFV